MGGRLSRLGAEFSELRAALWSVFVAQPLELLRQFNIAGNQRFLLRSRPSFQLLLASKTVSVSWMFFGVRKRYRATFCCVWPSATAIMIAKPLSEIVRLTDVQRTVAASQDVQEPHRTTMPSSAVKMK